MRPGGLEYEDIEDFSQQRIGLVLPHGIGKVAAIMGLGLSLACRAEESTSWLLCLPLLGIRRPEYACVLRLTTLAKHPSLLLGGRTSKEPSNLGLLIV